MSLAATRACWVVVAAGGVCAAGILLAVLAPQAGAQAAQAGATPIVLDPPVLMDVLSRPGAPSEIRYHAQAAKDGTIDLTATNGFFDRCFEALDPQKVIPGDAGLINVSFGYLGRLSDAAGGTARWHLWCPQAGQIKATFFIQVPAEEADHPWVIRAGDASHSLKVNASDGQSPQGQTLTFTVTQPGKVTVAIDCTANPPAAQTRIRFIRLEGSAISRASLLRVRWRPSAVHGHYYAPTNCPTPRMWVFETRDIGMTGSFSPLTTPFGYFGTMFKAGGRIAPGAGFNFSMWIAGRTATQAPPIEKMACLIGTDIPDAQYSTFGGEGTGIKFRAVAYKNGADRTIQALRVEAEGDVRTFYGYFYDEDAKRWRLYASAQAPQTRKNRSGELAGTGSFCEIPGPPNRERSGDLVREINRRGWFYGSDQKWYCAQLSGDARDAEAPAGPDIAPDPALQDPAKKSKAQRRAPAANDAAPQRASSQRVFYAREYATDGWMGMATGGMESYCRDAASRVMPTRKDGAPPVMPDYLSPEKTAQLFELPVRFGQSKVAAVAADRATIDYEIQKTGPNSQAVLYYGTVDSLTYAPRNVSKGSAVEIDMFRPERTWQSATPERKVEAGTAQFALVGLKAGTTYYYRLFVAHDEGKSWDYRSGRFTTGK